MVKKKTETVEVPAPPRAQITLTDKVALELPYELACGYRQVATVETLREFIKAVDDRFGSYNDANVFIRDGGVYAAETEMREV